jgi:hypothetical protein
MISAFFNGLPLHGMEADHQPWRGGAGKGRLFVKFAVIAIVSWFPADPSARDRRNGRDHGGT